MNALRAPDGGAGVAAIAAAVRGKVAKADANAAEAFAKLVCADLGAEELSQRGSDTWAALCADLFGWFRNRPAGRACVRAFNPDRDRDGWTCPHSVVEAVTDDAPFLVDSLEMVVAGAGLRLHRLLHPVMEAKRDARGNIGAVAACDGAGSVESVMHAEIDRVDDATLQQIQSAVEAAFGDVRAAVSDWQVMHDKMLATADALPKQKTPLDASEVAEGQAFLRWAADNHFTFLGYREYDVVSEKGDDLLKAREGSGLGILRDPGLATTPRSVKSLAASRLPQSGSMDAIILTKTNARSRVHRPGYMDYIGVLTFDDKGKPVSEKRFLGLYTSTSYMRRPQDVPLVRKKFESAEKRSGLRPQSHSGKAFRSILETLPRDELLQASADELYALATGIFDVNERRRARLFVRRDSYGRFFSCLVFIPRDHYNAAVGERVKDMLREELKGTHVDATALVGDSPMARMHVIVRPRTGEHIDVDMAALESKLAPIVRSWHDDLRDALVGGLGEERGAQLASRWGRAFTAGYIEDTTPARAAEDVGILAAMASGGEDLRLALHESYRTPGELHFKIFRAGSDIPLSEALPLLENAGLKVDTEQVHMLDAGGGKACVQDFVVRPAVPFQFTLEDLHARFEDAFHAIWNGRAENDHFNALVLRAGLGWRQIAMLRGYCKYQQQVGTPFSQAYMEETLNRYPMIAGLLVELFEAKFDPNRENGDSVSRKAAREALQRELGALTPKAVADANPEFAAQVAALLEKPREEQVDGLINAIKVLLTNVSSLDDDRILRGFMGQMRATLRTSYFQKRDGKPAEYISYKLDPHQVPDIPKPVPYREIWVYAPRVEGVHLRFGPVARGGLRWSDRREDFRTEVLGLVKAQMVKNTVIVPVGSKGGFFVKRPPAERDAQLQEGIACYKMFINGLLDITDNIDTAANKVLHPVEVVRHDDDDPYLVVAADKGTAKFSDIANGISIAHNYWLGDAFASGGSAGYDHKGMGITAKGGWESVKRHFRALGHDCQSEDFTCVGIGDMSGDVFGNGMLLSRHTRLLAAFDHRHIFIDPNPDAESSFVERERMFNLPRSSWDDYDKSKISKGGGVFARNFKAIALTPEMRGVLGIGEGVESLPPVELMSAILKAPVDLLWNGGIGTYVKAATESNADVGDRANNALRINGGELHCRIVGEGGNLGFTQKGRIEAAQKGVLLNTDFIDNSAGVDTSDHEVNIKILLNDAVQRGEMDTEARNKLLHSMTDEVERLVLRDNYRQNVALSLMEHMSVGRLGSKAHFIRTLEARGQLDRQIESLPSDAELAERRTHHQGLTRPELAVLLSYSKIVLYQQLLDSDVPEDPFLSHELVRYFPEPLHQKYAAHMQRHRLKREIIATAVTNSIVNRMGATFVLRSQEDTGETAAAVVKAYNAARQILHARELWSGIDALDGKVSEAAQIDALMKVWSLLRHVSRWLLNLPGTVLGITDLVHRYQPGMDKLRAALPDAFTETGRASWGVDLEKWQGMGFPDELAHKLATIPSLGVAMDVIETSLASGRPVEHVARVFFDLGEALDIEWLRGQIEKLPVESRWHAQARGALRDELAVQHRAMVGQILASEQARQGADGAVAAWLQRDNPQLQFTRGMLDEIRGVDVDYPIASVALRRLAQIAQSG
ncbi:MAG: NAD-glutamate dehydrogenase [Xanthomonadales bacterium]|nr:NAD-glutamate dehydrogenase [Xanthomonadales bacterium]ODU94887.1 MAG: glutamate dehydrogenase [Rhodanobacter sp. SCN 66-43]OJY82874.1 MAG: glutamate dehydrogenase [Xanthomonadales bacterium 66-474]